MLWLCASAGSGTESSASNFVTEHLTNVVWVIVPENVGNEEAVFVEPLAANFEILEQVHLTPTQRVVIVGDGKMGQLAVDF